MRRSSDLGPPRRAEAATSSRPTFTAPHCRRIPRRRDVSRRWGRSAVGYISLLNGTLLGPRARLEVKMGSVVARWRKLTRRVPQEGAKQPRARSQLAAPGDGFDLADTSRAALTAVGEEKSLSPGTEKVLEGAWPSSLRDLGILGGSSKSALYCTSSSCGAGGATLSAAGALPGRLQLSPPAPLRGGTALCARRSGEGREMTAAAGRGCPSEESPVTALGDGARAPTPAESRDEGLRRGAGEWRGGRRRGAVVAEGRRRTKRVPMVMTGWGSRGGGAARPELNTGRGVPGGQNFGQREESACRRSGRGRRVGGCSLLASREATPSLRAG
ncbi:hypothetical protein THAOC_22776 [Thalassiosira oceanica]|uniref:Uncharacterized protein n=1 Tax=Thalassiosira oceanica TaxID=159749 RepID=K0SF37_THAOC|nr:hypothetical protein THAOC_22776 [Thalassiosira oceanica]|eukprot:EJK57207.1 hypothetical protein THAOC_22776 [Thalassiosira oceanica]